MTRRINKLSLQKLKELEEDKLFGKEAEPQSSMTEAASRNRSANPEPEEDFWSETEPQEEEFFSEEELTEELHSYGKVYSEERVVRDSITRFFSNSKPIKLV